MFMFPNKTLLILPSLLFVGVPALFSRLGWHTAGSSPPFMGIENKKPQLTRRYRTCFKQLDEREIRENIVLKMVLIENESTLQKNRWKDKRIKPCLRWSFNSGKVCVNPTMPEM